MNATGDVCFDGFKLHRHKKITRILEKPQNTFGDMYMWFFRLWHWDGRVNFSPRKTILCMWYTCCRSTHVASNLQRCTKLLQPSPLRRQYCVFCWVVTCHCRTLSQIHEDCVENLGLYVSKEMNVSPNESNWPWNGKKLHRSWLNFRQKANYHYEAFGQNFLREKPSKNLCLFFRDYESS